MEEKKKENKTEETKKVVKSEATKNNETKKTVKTETPKNSESKKAESPKTVETKKEETKVEPKFQQATKKEADKVNKEQKKADKKSKDGNKKKSWIPTVIIAAVVVAIIVILTIMIATSSTPKGSVNAFFTNLKAGEFDKAQEYLSGDLSTLTNLTDDADAKIALFNKLNWKVKVVNEENDKATVEVEVTNKNFETILNNYTQKINELARQSIFGESSEISQQDFKTYFADELKNGEIETTTSSETLNLVKEDKKWKVVYDSEMVDAVLPGLSEAVED